MPEYPTYLDFSKIDQSKDFKKVFKFVGHGILAIGAALNILKVELSENTVSNILLPLTAFMSIPDIFQISTRWGPDYIAYI